MENNSELSPEQIKEISQNKKLRVGVAQGNFLFFFMLYFSHHLSYSLEGFHKEMMSLAIQENKDIVNIMAFRGSGKSTLLTLGLPLWSILSGKKKFILIISQSYQQAKLFLETLSSELQSNTLLQRDFDFFLSDTKYRKSELRIGNTYITIACIDTTLRGIKKGNTRPDLIICDDIETSNSIAFPKKRNRIYSWFKSEIIPLSGDTTKIILLGNYLGYQCFLEKLSQEMKNEVLLGVTRKYPIQDQKGEILWKGKYTKKDIEEIEKVVGDKKTWYHEFLIQGIPYEENTLKRNDFTFYYGSPKKRVIERKNAGVYISPTKLDGSRGNILICGATIFGINDDIRIYLHPNYVYKTLQDKEIANKILELLNKNMITKRRWIYCDRQKMDRGLFHYLSSEHIYEHGVLFKQHTSSKLVFDRQIKDISYDYLFKKLTLLIQSKRIIFPKKGGYFLEEEIMKYKIDGYISVFMKDFLDMISHLIEGSNDSFKKYFGDMPRSPFINCCILDEEFFYADEEVKYKDLKGDLVDWYRQRYKYV